MIRKTNLLIALLLFTASVVSSQDENGINPEDIIKRIVMIEKRMMAEVMYITYDAEYIEGETEKDGTFKEEFRFIKKVRVKYLADTSLIDEEYLEFYKDGKLMDEEKLENEAKDRIEKKEKRKAKDISFSMLEPFYDENRELYDIKYNGIMSETVDDYTCYHFKVKAKEEDEQLINGDFYFDVETFNPVRVDFSPAKLVKKMMFKMKEMSMSISYGPVDGFYWLPKKFEISGKGKAMFFIGVSFSGAEYYRNPVINEEGAEKYFEGQNGN